MRECTHGVINLGTGSIATQCLADSAQNFHSGHFCCDCFTDLVAVAAIEQTPIRPNEQTSLNHREVAGWLALVQQQQLQILLSQHTSWHSLCCSLHRDALVCCSPTSCTLFGRVLLCPW